MPITVTETMLNMRGVHRYYKDHAGVDIKWTMPSYHLKLNFDNFTLGNIGDMRIGKVIKDNRDRSLEKISTSYDLTIEAEILVLLKQLIEVAPWVSVSS